MAMVSELGGLLSAQLSGGIQLRRQSGADADFLSDLYVSRRWGEMQAVPGWDNAMRRAFLRDQARLQAAHYAGHFPQADFFILQHGQAPVGRLALGTVAPDDLRIIDIALLPAWCGQGIGSRILQRILNIADQRDLFCSLHVLETNPAIRLYKRLGFLPVHQDIPYILMRHSPP